MNIVQETDRLYSECSAELRHSVRNNLVPRVNLQLVVCVVKEQKYLVNGCRGLPSLTPG